MTVAQSLHDSAVIFDGACPQWGDDRYVDYWTEGGVTVMAPTIAGVHDNCTSAMKTIGRWLTILQDRSQDLLHVTRAQHFREAKDARKLGILFHFQNASAMERDVELAHVYATLGV